MKIHFSIIVFLTFVTLIFLPNSFAQEAALERVVRLFYFLPNDRRFRPEVVQKMKDEIRNVQAFYGEQMQAHGHGYKTFQIETDAQGEPIVHRVDGQYPDSHYQSVHSSYILEVYEKFGRSSILNNVYFIVWDNSTGSIEGAAGWGSLNQATATAKFGFRIAAHELGHAFGLSHDFRDEGGIMGGRTRALSACAAKFLSVNPFFNPDIRFEWISPPIIELILWTVATLTHISTLFHEGTGASTINSVAFSPDGAILASGVGNRIPRAIYLWDVATKDNITILPIRDTISSVAFSPDGAILASSSGHGNIRLWDVATGTQIATFPYPDEVRSVSLSPDGSILAAGARDGTVTLWDVSSYITPSTPTQIAEDVSGDGVVSNQDLVLVASNLGQTGENRADVNKDGVVDVVDLLLVLGALGDAAAAPSAHPQVLEFFTAADVQQWLIQALQLSLTDVRAQRGHSLLGTSLGSTNANRDGTIGQLPKSVQSGDLDTVSTRGICGCHADYLCGRWRSSTHFGIGTSTRGYLSEPQPRGVLGWQK